MKQTARANTETKRIFFGIPLPEELSASFVGFQKDHEHLKGVRWVPERNQHITVIFIGNVAADNVDLITERLHEVAARTEPFTMEFKALRLGPKRSNARMIWATFKKNKSFKRLVLNCRAVLEPFVDPKTSFKKPKAHVTLARFKQFKNVGLLNLDHHIEPKTFKVNSAVLWRSHLEPSGAEYHALQEFTFL